MWNAEDIYNKQLEKHSNLTYCLNVSLKVHEKDLFWYITNEILKWALWTAHLRLKLAAMIFFHFWPIFIDRPWKRSIFCAKRLVTEHFWPHFFQKRAFFKAENDENTRLLFWYVMSPIKSNHSTCSLLFWVF